MIRVGLALISALMAAPAVAAPCGGDFGEFVAAMKAEALANGQAESDIDAFFAGAAIDPKVLKADRSQGVFRKTFLEFSKALISKSRLSKGAALAQDFDPVFDKAANDYGIPRGILLAFWAFETDFGAVQGDFNTRNALVTLAQDCRRPELFQPQIFAGITLTGQGIFDPANTVGAWAGEIGMVQMLPKDIVEQGVDGDGDGTIRLKTSAPDALLSAAKKLQSLGWQAGAPWLQEIVVPNGLDWSKTGLETQLSIADWAAMGVVGRGADLPDAATTASVLLPQGRKGPAFLAFPNFEVLFEWNKSFVYVTTAAYFATRLEGAAPYDQGAPDQGLDPDQMMALQKKLQELGYDIGKIDGILGAATRAAVQREQSRLGLPADAWPTADLLKAL
jgi:lytic murein transglycosylase